MAPSNAAPRVSAIIASASPSRSGSMRNAKSRITSTAVPPMPNARNETEIGIARDAGEDLDAAGDELLHQEGDVGRAWIESGRCAR